MTRETKIGMIVAGSFLSLVGVVVGTKLLKHDLPDNTAPQTLVSNSGEPKKNPPPPGSAAPTGAKPPEEIKLAEFKTPKTLPPLAPQGPGLPPSLPDPNLPSIPTAPTIPAAPVDDTTARLQALKAAQEKELHHGD
ncbi:MAG TPA: hypothetical protein VHR72_09620, partial [Gemmataceae bacterium]|nr:hypothetical protein [Gemmataceae bacterium]